MAWATACPRSIICLSCESSRLVVVLLGIFQPKSFAKSMVKIMPTRLIVSIMEVAPHTENSLHRGDGWGIELGMNKACKWIGCDPSRVLFHHFRISCHVKKLKRQLEGQVNCENPTLVSFKPLEFFRQCAKGANATRRVISAPTSFRAENRSGKTSLIDEFSSYLYRGDLIPFPRLNYRSYGFHLVLLNRWGLEKKGPQFGRSLGSSIRKRQYRDMILATNLGY